MFDSYSLHGVNGEDWGQGETPVFSTQVLSRTVGGRFWYRISLLYRRSLFLTPNASENESSTTGSLFLHRTHIPYREGPLRYRMPQTAERRRALPAANATTARKEEPSVKSAARDAAASKKITAKKFAIPPQICSTPRLIDHPRFHNMPYR